MWPWLLSRARKGRGSLASKPSGSPACPSHLTASAQSVVGNEEPSTKHAQAPSTKHVQEPSTRHAQAPSTKNQALTGTTRPLTVNPPAPVSRGSHGQRAPLPLEIETHGDPHLARRRRGRVAPGRRGVDDRVVRPGEHKV